MMSKNTKDMEFLFAHDFNNLADMPDNQDFVIRYILQQYKKGKIYNWVGPLLLAINPKRPIADLYNCERANEYTKSIESPRMEVKPHIFAVAAYARYRVIRELGNINQVIVISGDSGSGKTFSAAKILNFLSNSSQPYPNTGLDGTPSILSRIGCACTLISAFSTASTERNMHSSRHGQFVQLQYVDNSIAGAVLNSFLLEQTRVTSGRNNFHIFNQVRLPNAFRDIMLELSCGSQVLEGLPNSELNAFKLRRNTAYNIVSKVYGISQEDYINWYGNTIEAMNRLGIGKKQTDDIFKVVAILIHLGNIEFQEHGTAACSINLVKKESAEGLEGSCALTLLSDTELIQLLTTSLICTQSRTQRRSVYRLSIGSIEACVKRLHSIIRYLYQRLFNWLVQLVNVTLACNREHAKLLGILDIFGFECFASNSIEQLSINYANERLQAHFMEEYLHAGRSELEEEGLTMIVSPANSFAHRYRIAAIEEDLFHALNDACLVARIQKYPDLELIMQSSENDRHKYIQPYGDIFIIDHYSCPVKYHTADILNKNTDKVPSELLSTFSLCKNEFILILLKDDEKKIQETGRSSVKKNTWLAKLKQSMDVLVKELDQNDLHYIRCIKPVEYDNEVTMMREFEKQLACSGILDTLSLARCALPIRLKYDELFKRYFEHVTKTSDPMSIFKNFLRGVFNNEEVRSSVHFGTRLIFLSETVLFELELWRDKYRSRYASKIQKCWLKYRTRKKIQFFESSGKNSLPKNDTLEQLENNTAEQMHEDLCLSKTDNSASHHLFDKSTGPRFEMEDLSARQIDIDELRRGSRDRVRFASLTKSTTIDEGRQCSLMSINNHTFFCRRGMCSRRHLADVPIRFHTRVTCLSNSHRLPRSELPNGLQDSL